jgi:hypothetical protein
MASSSPIIISEEVIIRREEAFPDYGIDPG